MTLLDTDPRSPDFDDSDLLAALTEDRRAEDDAAAAAHADMSASVAELLDRAADEAPASDWTEPVAVPVARRPWWSIFRRQPNATEQWWAEVYARRGLS